MLYKAFLQLEGVTDRSTAFHHLGEIEIYRPMFFSSPAPGNSGLKFRFFKNTDSTSPTLHTKVQYGWPIKKGAVTVETIATDTLKAVQHSRIEMADITVTNYYDGVPINPNLKIRPTGQVPPAAGDREFVEEITLDVGKVLPNILSLLGIGILSFIGAS